MKFNIACLLIVGASAITTMNINRPKNADGEYLDYFQSESGHDGHWSYNRNDSIPENLGGPGSGDDMFAWSMIANYAMERADKATGVPTGEFYFNPISARMAAREILKTHLGLEGDAATEYLNKYFQKTWDHFDTASEGEITADRMSTFFRFLCANMQIVLH